MFELSRDQMKLKYFGDLRHSCQLAYLDKLSEPFSEDELRDYYNEFNGVAETDAGKPMLDGITAFHDSLAAIEKDSVVLFSIT
jgi:hypothetical protein